MKRTLLAVASGALGLVFCPAAIAFANAVHITPNFPAPGGEDDFGVRAALFFFAVWPAFVAMSTYIGYAATGNLVRTTVSWCGVVVGSSLNLLLAYASRIVFSSIAVANVLAIGFLLSWLVLAALGAYAADRFLRRLSQSPEIYG